MNRTALITGGSRGIGLAIAKSFQEDDYKVAIASRYPERTREELGSNILVIEMDALDTTTYRDKIIQEVILEFGSLDVLINNIGGGGRWGSFYKDQYHEVPYDVWRDVLQKNTWVATELICEVLPYMMSNRFGRIVNIGSIFGTESGGNPWFSMAKAAQLAMIKVFSTNKAYVHKNITFNTVSPGRIDIGVGGESQGPMKNIGQTRDVSRIVKMICHPDSHYINGSNFIIDGGESHAI